MLALVQYESTNIPSIKFPVKMCSDNILMKPVVGNLAVDHAICAYNMTPTDLLRYWLEFIFNAENHNDFE